MNPFDFAWMLLKQETRSHFGGVESFPERWKNLREHGDVRGAEPEGGWSGKQLEIGHDEAPDAPTPDLETPSATAPDRPADGMSPQDKLEALIAEHPDYFAGLGFRVNGDKDEPV